MLLRQTLLYLPAQLVAPLAQVAAALAWTHWLAPAPYGVLTLVIASQDLLFLLCQSWWTQFTLRYLGALRGPARDDFLHSEASVAALAFAAQAVAALAVPALAGAAATPGLCLAAAAFVGTRSLLTHLGERARAGGRIGAYTLGQLTGSLAGFAGAFALVAVVAATPAAVLAGFAGAQAAGAALMWRGLGVAGWRWPPRRAALAAAAAYGAPLLVAGGAGWLALNGIRLVVEGMAGADALGLVAVGWGLGQRVTATGASLVVAAAFPLAVRLAADGSRAAGAQQLGAAGVLLAGLVLPAAVGLALLSEPFAAVFVAEPFRAATVAVLPLAAAAGALRNLRMHVAEPVFLLIERPGMTTALNVADAALVVAGCAIGLAVGGPGTAGLVGAVGGCLAGTVASLVVGLAAARLVAGFSFPYRDVGRVALASAAMGAVLAAVPWATLVPRPALRLVAEPALGVLVYAGALALLGPGLVRSLARRPYRVGTGVPLR